MLYFVATPIGNLSEITFRAVETLKNADVIYAEDTRHTLVLLNEYGIKKPLVSYQKFNERARLDEIVERLKSGQNVCVVSDAGMPAISDPGGELTKRLVDEGLEFTVISGACALINALVLSGLDTSAFCMVGFLPQKLSDKKKLIERFALLEATLIFYSAPHDILRDLEFLHAALGSRRVAVVREISKKFETVHRGVLGSDLNVTEKGEMVIVVEGAARAVCTGTPAEYVEKLMASGLDKMEAVKQTAKLYKLPKNEVYKVALSLKSDKNRD